MKSKKDYEVVAMVTEIELAIIQEINYLRNAARRILVDCEKKEKEFWAEMSGKYGVTEKDRCILHHPTREIRKSK